MATEIRTSLEHIPRLPYYALFPSRLPLLPQKFRQLRETGVRLMIGTDAGIPAMFHSDATWREMVTFVEMGVSPMETLQAATLWPARFLRAEDRIGVLAPGRYADIILVHGNPLTDMTVVERVSFVMKGGVVIRR